MSTHEERCRNAYNGLQSCWSDLITASVEAERLADDIGQNGISLTNTESFVEIMFKLSGWALDRNMPEELRFNRMIWEGSIQKISKMDFKGDVAITVLREISASLTRIQRDLWKSMKKFIKEEQRTVE